MPANREEAPLTHATAPADRLPTSTIVAFSTLSLPLGALAVAIAVYLPPYFASHLGISLTVIGGAWALVRLLDIGVDPALGLVMDRTRTRFGRYRLWTLIGAPVLMVSLYALFLAPKGVGGSYLVVWLLVMYLGQSILALGQSAWGATLSPAYHERSRLFGALAAVGVAGAAVVLLIPIAGEHLGRSEAQSIQAMGWFMIWLIPLATGVVLWRTPERIAPATGAPQFRLRDYGALIVKPDLARLYLAQMALALGPGWMSALYVFFFTDARRYSPEAAAVLLLVYVVAGIVGAPSTAGLARRLGKHRALMVTTTAYSLGLCLVMAIPKGSVGLALPVMAWCGAMAAGFDLMIRAMLADVADEVRLEQGQERMSLIYALNTLAAKIAAAFAIGVTFPLISRLGYDATRGAANTPEAIHSLELAFIVGPIVFVMLGGACVLGWRLDAVRHGEVRRRLEERDAQYAEAPIVESVGVEPAAPVLSEPGSR